MERHLGDGGQLTGDAVDTWLGPLQCVLSLKNDDFNSEDKDAWKRLKRCCSLCNEYLLSVTPVIVTALIESVFTRRTQSFAQEKHDLKCKGIIVSINEAAEADELNLWCPTFHANYHDKVTGAILTENEKQIRPVHVDLRRLSQSW